jgi:hypothetical protein
VYLVKSMCNWTKIHWIHGIKSVVISFRVILVCNIWKSDILCLLSKFNFGRIWLNINTYLKYAFWAANVILSFNTVLKISGDFLIFKPESTQKLPALM